MPKPLDITQRQVTALMKAAKATGCAVEYELSTGVIRILPDIPVSRPQKNKPLDIKFEGHF
jgi:hypothetical protein